MAWPHPRLCVFAMEFLGLVFMPPEPRGAPWSPPGPPQPVPGVEPVQPLRTAWSTLHPTASRPLVGEFAVTWSVLLLSCAHHLGPPTPGQSRGPHGPSRPHSDQGGLCALSPFPAGARGLGVERTGWAIMSTWYPQESSRWGQGPEGSPEPPLEPGEQLLQAAGSEPPACERLEWQEQPRGAHCPGQHVGTCALGARVLLAGVLGEGTSTPGSTPPSLRPGQTGWTQGCQWGPGWWVLGCDLASPRETQALVYDTRHASPVQLP